MKARLVAVLAQAKARNPSVKLAAQFDNLAITPA
jgi:hypothetical protein